MTDHAAEKTLRQQQQECIETLEQVMTPEMRKVWRTFSASHTEIAALRERQWLDASIEKPKDTTDHAAAAAEALEKIVAQLRAGRPPEELGPNVILVGRMMARRT